ncbi:MAG: AAA family ATPase [Acetobacteraceae bacterium]
MLHSATDPGSSPRGSDYGYPREPSERARTTVPVFLAALRQRQGILFATVALIILSAYLMLRQVTPLYTATGSLIYQPNIFTLREMQSILRTDPTTEAVMASQAELLHSLHIAQRVAERGNLFDDPAFNAALRAPGLLRRSVLRLRDLFGLEADEPPDEDDETGPPVDRIREQTLIAVRAALRATPVRGSHVIDVSFTAADPLVAAAAVNNAMDVYIKDQYAAKHAAVDRATALLERQAGDLRKQVASIEESIAAYRSNHRLSRGMHASTDNEAITHLTEDLVKARTELAGANARLDVARGHAGAAALAALAPSVVQLRAQTERLAVQIQSQQTRLGPAHPDARSLSRQFAEAERALKSEVARVVAATEAEQNAAIDRVAALEAELRRAQQDEDRAAKAGIPLEALERDLAAARSQLQAVLERKQQTAQQAAVETSEAREISQALPPTQQSSPRPLQVMAASAAGSVFIALMLVYVLHLADGTIHTGDELRMVIGLPCFARVPEVRRRALGAVPIYDYGVRRSLSPFAEQIRALRAGLRFRPEHLEPGHPDHPTVLAITSARSGEGKSVTAIALGRCAQIGGNRVLVIECDLRLPTFMLRFAGAQSQPPTPPPGLSEILTGDIEWRDCIQDDPLTDMKFIPAGRPSGQTLELFPSEALISLLYRARQEYDLVLLDAPPLLAMTEARVVAAAADGALLCVHWRSTPRATLLTALDLLHDAKAKVIGTVLTRVDSHAHLRSGYADAEVYRRRSRHHHRG